MASNDGTVIWAQLGEKGSGYNDYGYIITLWHGNNRKTVYAKLKEGSLKVSVEQQVKKGQVIAQIDTFLHYEQRIGSKEQHPTEDSFMDPLAFPALVVDKSLTNKAASFNVKSDIQGKNPPLNIDSYDNLNGLE